MFCDHAKPRAEVAKFVSDGEQIFVTTANTGTLRTKYWEFKKLSKKPSSTSLPVGISSWRRCSSLESCPSLLYQKLFGLEAS
jgi:hypothetical protein